MVTNIVTDIQNFFANIAGSGNITLSRVGGLQQARLSQGINIPISQLIASPNQASQNPIFQTQVGPMGAWLYSAAIECDSFTQTNYMFQISIDGVTIDGGYGQGNNYFQMPVSFGYNPVPEGVAWLLPAGAWIKIYAYNFNGATSNGLISVSVCTDENTS